MVLFLGWPPAVRRGLALVDHFEEPNRVLEMMDRCCAV